MSSLVSVVIPTHNRPELVGRAVRSVLAQTYKSVHIIVVDDGDAPRAEAVLAPFVEAGVVTYLETKKNQGAPTARNIGIREAKGEFIAFLDDDDEWLPEKLARQVAALESAPPDVSLAFTGVQAIDQNREELYQRLPGSDGLMQPYERLLRRCFIWSSSILMRRSYAERGFIFDETLTKNQEWDLEIRLLQVSRFYAINEPMTILHMGAADQLGGVSNLPRIIAGHERFIEKHRAEYERFSHAYSVRLFVLGNFYWQGDRKAEARAAWGKAWRLYPRRFGYLKRLLVSYVVPHYSFT